MSVTYYCINKSGVYNNYYIDIYLTESQNPAVPADHFHRNRGGSSRQPPRSGSGASLRQPVVGVPPLLDLRLAEVRISPGRTVC